MKFIFFHTGNSTDREIFRALSSNTVWKRYELGLFVFLGLSSHWFPLWSQDGCRSAARATHILSFQQEEKARIFFFSLCHCRVMIPFLDILSESTFSPVGLRARPPVTSFESHLSCCLLISPHLIPAVVWTHVLELSISTCISVCI